MLKIYIILFIKCLLIVNFGLTQQNIGDECVVARTGAQGTCKIITDCPAAIEDLKNNIGDPAVCSYFGNSPIVCCANSILQTSTLTTTEPTTAPITNRISAKKCEEYTKMFYEHVNASDLICHTLEVIVGGTIAKAGEFPHMALIGYGESEDIKWLCGGSLISERFVLTAGHCLNTREIGSAKYVKLGVISLNTTSDDAKPVEVEIAERIPYRKYTKASHYFDIALLRLANDIQFNQNVHPICLAEKFEPDTSTAIATGWGHVIWDDERMSDKLLKVTLDFFTYKKCNESYASDINRRLKDGIIDSLQICAGSHDESKDTCQGDSGGPLQIYHDICTYEIVGIASFGKICGTPDFPGVYTRVFPYLDWIESQVWQYVH